MVILVVNYVLCRFFAKEGMRDLKGFLVKGARNTGVT